MTGEKRMIDTVLWQVDVWWFGFRRRLEGLTDDELWWKPVPDAWTLRAGDDGVFRYEWPPGSQGEAEPPFTTMAWRLAHVGFMAMAHWAMILESDDQGNVRAQQLPFPPTADEVRHALDLWWLRWREAMLAGGDERLSRPIHEVMADLDEPMMGMGRDEPYLSHVLHQHREFIHHGAEVALLRDLYRSRQGQPSA